MVDEQPIGFLRYAPTVVAAMDAIHKAEQEREMKRQKAQGGDDPGGARFNGRR